jgi:glycosyltransferase involved in cell wall biosynthesis
MQGWIYQRTDGLITVCQSYAHALRERFRLPSQRVTAVRGAVDADRFTPEGVDLRNELGIAPQAPMAGIVARIKPERHHVHLLRAFQPLAQSLPDARLLIVGRGEGLQPLQREVARLGLARSVIFGGYRTGAELAAAYRAMDVKVLLAEGNDGSCRALLEAMACGRAAVAYRFGAPAETIVDGVTGLLVDRGDVAALSHALARLLKSRSYCRDLGAAGREAVLDRFTELQRGDAVENFLTSVLKLPRAAARERGRPTVNPL